MVDITYLKRTGTYLISDGFGESIEIELYELKELKNLIEKVLTNPEDCDTM